MEIHGTCNAFQARFVPRSSRSRDPLHLTLPIPQRFVIFVVFAAFWCFLEPCDLDGAQKRSATLKRFKVPSLSAAK